MTTAYEFKYVVARANGEEFTREGLWVISDTNPLNLIAGMKRVIAHEWNDGQGVVEFDSIALVHLSPEEHRELAAIGAIPTN